MAVSLEPVTKVSDELKELLNKAIAREIQVSIQYMWQHVEVRGVKGVAVQGKFQEVAIAEMKHAEKIANSGILGNPDDCLHPSKWVKV
jgi:bacterioferritin (cytochrome b1)